MTPLSPDRLIADRLSANCLVANRLVRPSQWLLVSGLVFSLVSCGADLAAPPLEAATEPASSTAQTPDPSPAPDTGTEDGTGARTNTREPARLYLADIEDPQAAREFVEQMRQAAIAGDRQTIANLIHYPFTTYDRGVPLKTYQTPAEFIADFETVVTEPVLNAMAEADFANLWVNSDDGVTIGVGEVWFRQYEDGIKIRAINSL